MAFRRTLLVMAILGGIVSAYLVFHHFKVRYGSQAPSFCNISQTMDCDRVAMHENSEVMGVPVAAYGVVSYLFLVFLLAGFGSWAVAEPRRSAFVILIAFANGLVSLYLAAVSWGIIHSICLVCAVTYVDNAVVVILAVFSLGRCGGFRGWAAILIDEWSTGG